MMILFPVLLQDRVALTEPYCQWLTGLYDRHRLGDGFSWESLFRDLTVVPGC